MARKKRRGRPAGQPNKPRRRSAFVFLAHWYDAIDALPTDCQLEIYQMLSQYALTGVEPPSMSITARSILLMAKKDIDPDLERWRAHLAVELRGNPNFKEGHTNPYTEKIRKTKAEQKAAEEQEEE